MRLWSIHPQYLDAQGLLAVWREALLAKKVLLGQTKGYTKHPQLVRFKESGNSLLAINCYLKFIYQESLRRGYHFNSTKFNVADDGIMLDVTTDQLQYEFQHLLKKLKTRDSNCYELLLGCRNIQPHPMFKVKEGGVESWEKVI